MRKSTRSVLLNMIAAAALFSCMGAMTAMALEPDETYKVDVILKTTSSEYWGYVMDGANAYMADHPNVTVDVKGASSETAYDEQKEMIAADLQDESYDAYVIAPLNGDDVVSAIAGEERPVIALDTEIEADEIIQFA